MAVAGMHAVWWSTDACGSSSLQMTRNPGYYGLQLRTSDPAAIKAAIREKFVNTALKQLAEHGMVQQRDETLSAFDHRTSCKTTACNIRSRGHIQLQI